VGHICPAGHERVKRHFVGNVIEIGIKNSVETTLEMSQRKVIFN